ncbi:MAG: hypothetical protein Q9159_000429 [Coniocarpon cinnabarinum]
MKRRITYVTKDEEDVKAATVDAGSENVQVHVKAAKEDKLITSLDELVRGNATAAQELSSVLKHTQELFIRWTSPHTCEQVSPFYARYTPGLHVFWTPAEGLNVSNSTASLNHLTTHHHSLLPVNISSACTLTLTYDALIGSLGISSYVAPLDQVDTLPSRSTYGGNAPQLELGILTQTTNPVSSSHELTLSGLLATPPNTPKETYFTFPSRHHTVSETFIISFDQSTGLHPLLRLQFPTPPQPPLDGCELRTLLALPSALFIDRYAFRDALFLSSHNLTSLRAITGATDLEAPEWLVPQWGSSALFELESGTEGATVPLHTRYLRPVEGGYRSVEMGVPDVFWACHAEEGGRFGVNPFDVLGWEGGLGDRVGLWHLMPTSSSILHGAGSDKRREVSQGSGVGSTGAKDARDLILSVSVPVLDTSAVTAPWIESVTMGVVMAGFFWIVWKLTRPLNGPERQSGSREETSRKGAKEL